MTRPDSTQKLLLVVVVFLGVLLLGPYLGINLLGSGSSDRVPAAVLSIDNDLNNEELEASDSSELEPLDPAELKKLNIEQIDQPDRASGARDGITEIEQLLEDR